MRFESAFTEEFIRTLNIFGAPVSSYKHIYEDGVVEYHFSSPKPGGIRTELEADTYVEGLYLMTKIIVKSKMRRYTLILTYIFLGK